jgi:hypothetical protein
VEYLREFQDYLLAHRLRVFIGGKLNPKSKPLSLAKYAQKRLERQELAKDLLKGDYREQLRKVDALTDELNFGFWQNPNESIMVLKSVIQQGGCLALESKEAFIDSLLTKLERQQLSSEQETLIASYYLGLFQASAAYLDAEVFTRLRSEVDVLRDSMPIFMLNDGVATG